MRTELYTPVVAGTVLLGGCAQVLGIEDLPPLVDARSPGGNMRQEDAGIPDAVAGFPDASAPDAADAREDDIDLARGLVGHWPLDATEPGGSGSITRDASGNGFDGEVKGTEVVAGRVGMALRFDGDGDSVRIGNQSALDFEGPITLSVWCRLAIVDQRIRNIVAHGNTNDPQREVFLRIDAADQYEGGSWDGRDHKAVLAIPASDILGDWVHLAAVYDGQDWILYHAGLEMHRKPDPVGAVTVDEDWFIGARLGSNADRFFQGDIDEVRIYDRALSPAEIAALAAP